jgi:hypothetical protein
MEEGAMKIFKAAVLACGLAGLLSAQEFKSVGGFGNVVFPGLGHAPATSNPWGNVAHPATPQGSPTFTNLAFSNHGGYGSYGGGYGSYGGGYRHGGGTGIFAYPVYVGGYGYGYGYGYGNGADPSTQQPNVTVVYPPAQPPVIINQNFATPDQGQGPDTIAGPGLRMYQSPTGGAPQAGPDTAATTGEAPYYLIAFKDHTIYSAIAYYVEGDTLHYFTAGNVHNQVSLSLVDQALTEQLNRERNVDVRLSK